jgi:hypothetical protein
LVEPCYKINISKTGQRLFRLTFLICLYQKSLGNGEQEHLPETFKNKGIAQDQVKPKSELKKTNRSISCFLQGLINILADLLCGKGISLNNLFPHSSVAFNTS